MYFSLLVFIYDYELLKNPTVFGVGNETIDFALFLMELYRVKSLHLSKYHSLLDESSVANGVKSSANMS